MSKLLYVGAIMAIPPYGILFKPFGTVVQILGLLIQSIGILFLISLLTRHK